MNIRTRSFDRERVAVWRDWLRPVLEVLLGVLLAAQAARRLWMLLVPIAPIGASAATMPIQAAAPSLPMVDLFFRRARHAASPGNNEALGSSLPDVRTDGMDSSAILQKDRRQASPAAARETTPAIPPDEVRPDPPVLALRHPP